MKTIAPLFVLIFGFLINSQAQNKENIIPKQKGLPDWADSVKIKRPDFKIMADGTPNILPQDSTNTNPVDIPNSLMNRRLIQKDDSIILIKPLDGKKNSPMPGTEPLDQKKK
ncbi:hypothetical protein [Sphingobacterium hotanense]|uniref:hypothetical protein n=1 Tax=Sphingobacterium hotanense TaxID=649196 RepID=UPI0011F19FCD|nr:hypothetical protein [Sphingobacterium hotanense]